MTDYSSNCSECQEHCDWVEYPTGGRWEHHSIADHDPVIDWQPPEYMDSDGNWVAV
jgi:hypothetical protein